MSNSNSKLEEINARIAALEKQAKEEKARLKKEKAELELAKKAAKKAAKEGGVIASIVSVLLSYAENGVGKSKAERIALCYEKGKSKEQILSLLLAKLGKDENHADAPLHLATLNVQLGKRILPRLEAKGYSLSSVRADGEKFSLYLAFNEAEAKPSEEKPSIIVRKAAKNG